MGETKPRPRGVDSVKDAPLLLEGRYGTKEMCDIWGTDADTYIAIMEAQISGLEVLDRLYPGKIPRQYIDALRRTANFEMVNPDHIRELEATKRHDVVAINTAWGEAADRICPGASSVINFIRTSADSTETAKNLRCMRSFEVYADSVENLRDITLEKSMEWIDKPWMDQTHLYDALPTVAGRPLSFFAEMLQSDLDFIRFVYDKSLLAKWADATGNSHSALSAGIDGIMLQRRYADRLGLGYMMAPGQITGREFNADIMYALSRTAGTFGNMGHNIALWFGNDADLLTDTNPRKRKGSSAMPHKDIAGGNRIDEEQAESFHNEMIGKMATAIATIKFRYARDLSSSASDRLDVGPSFKFGDHVARRMAEVVYYLGLNEARSKERVERTFGVVTSEQVLTYLVDPSSPNPMGRKEAHDLIGELATRAYNEERPFHEVLRDDPRVASRIPYETLTRITNPFDYIGQSREIVGANYDSMHGRKTFDLR
ncbi:MAG: hypothetical protein HYT73_04670 [Candidatus Aenigmarchaeota archaeon]|nr:hypothetical protein [Candidatus Aenigmarchaeota archaeon]